MAGELLRFLTFGHRVETVYRKVTAANEKLIRCWHTCEAEENVRAIQFLNNFKFTWVGGHRFGDILPVLGCAFG